MILTRKEVLEQIYGLPIIFLGVYFNFCCFFVKDLNNNYIFFIETAELLKGITVFTNANQIYEKIENAKFFVISDSFDIIYEN